MGVKDLWSILSPVCEKKSLWELSNKTVAIDLSAWICDSQAVASTQLNMYIRNIFFRTSYLILIGVKPLFVLEGVAPDLKKATIRSRLKRQAGTEGDERLDPPTKGDTKLVRSRLISCQKQCCQLLDALGVPYIRAPGEAEAFCAHLNQLGIVEAVVTQDSDVFLYGAVEVFRNCRMSSSGGGSQCEHYSMRLIQEKLGLTRQRLVGYSLLAGSDYNSKVHRLGKQEALKFLLSVPDHLIIQKFLDWRNDSVFSQIESQKFMNSDLQLELKIRQKCLQDECFPDLEVVREFMQEPQPVSFQYQWKQPDLPKFVGLAVKKLAWEEEYAIGKLSPLLSRWHLHHPGLPSDRRMTVIKGVPVGKESHCYSVLWDTGEGTLEPKELVQAAYPDLVQQYLAAQESKRAPRRKRKGDVDGLRKRVVTKEALNSKSNKIGSEEMMLVDDLSVQGAAEPSTSVDPFNLSDIILNIVSRPASNPALHALSHKF